MKDIPCLSLVAVITLGLAVPKLSATDADARAATVTDRAGVESHVSNLTVSNLDERFSFENPDDRNHVVVGKRDILYALPLDAITSIVQNGSDSWTIKYQGPDSAQEVTGDLPADALLLGSSDFGTFSLRLRRLKKLEFGQAGAALKPARRRIVRDREGKPQTPNFEAVLTLTDGTKLNASILRRNEVYAEQVNDDNIEPAPPPAYTFVATNYVDLHLVRGETVQIVPFQNIASAEFFPGESVLIKTVSGTEAEMKLPRRDERSLEGFTGNCAKGDFYVPLQSVRLITFGAAPRQP